MAASRWKKYGEGRVYVALAAATLLVGIWNVLARADASPEPQADQSSVTSSTLAGSNSVSQAPSQVHTRTRGS